MQGNPCTHPYKIFQLCDQELGIAIANSKLFKTQNTPLNLLENTI